MRSRTILLALLLALSVTGACFAAAAVYEPHDQVRLTETVRYGDRAAAAGIVVRMETTYDLHLHWRTDVTLGGEPETEYTFSAARVYQDAPRTYGGLWMEWTQSVSSTALDSEADGGAEGLERAYRELRDTLGPGGEREIEIRLKDYLDYYPLTFSIDLPNDTTHQWLDQEARDDPTEPVPGSNRHTLVLLREYFRFPVLEDDRLMISLGKDTNGRVFTSGSGGTDSDTFHPWTYSAVAGDACYFTFDAHTQEGALADLSALPEGYGVYRLPYHDVPDKPYIGNKLDAPSGVDAAALEMVYPLEPGIRLLQLDLSPEETELLLHAVENGTYCLTVINLATMETLQKLEIAPWDEESSFWQLYEGDGFLAPLLTREREAVVLERLADGRYALRYRCQIPQETFDCVSRCFGTQKAALDFDGERLVIAGVLCDPERAFAKERSGFFTALYDETGLLYYGEFQSSLSDQAPVHACLPVEWNPVTVRLPR